MGNWWSRKPETTRREEIFFYDPFSLTGNFTLRNGIEVQYGANNLVIWEGGRTKEMSLKLDSNDFYRLYQGLRGGMSLDDALTGVFRRYH